MNTVVSHAAVYLSVGGYDRRMRVCDPLPQPASQEDHALQSLTGQGLDVDAAMGHVMFTPTFTHADRVHANNALVA